MTKKLPIVNKSLKIHENPLVWSSLTFSTNMIHAFYSGLYTYSICFAFLTITSIIVHTEYNIYTNIIDKFAIAIIVIYGGYRVWSKIDGTLRTSLLIFLCVLTFCISVGLYIYKSGVNDDTLYHIMMHYISSLGHHFIILL